MIGFLDNTSTQKDLKANAKLNLPLWLAEPLCSANITEIGMPKTLSTKARNSLIANSSISLERSPFFFEIARKVADHHDDEELRRIAIAALSERCRVICNKCQNENWMSDDYFRFSQSLTETEKKFMAIGREATIEFENWRGEKTKKMLPASIFISQKQISRKRLFSHTDPSKS
eukprot:TRINITY_DN10359_c0_g1_i1.p1 TRINITY_DN10359_c0_g1~~TRINITY_DN10359_c0_g1_i1.p1  ORF type:complete len:200 (+),score=77.28 TRINITY_DN10359_c0_g1_i1:80-601(+)